jgi:hypothetical protein
MRVYLPGRKGYHTVICTPARDARGQALDGAEQWKDPNGEPIQYAVRFVDGVASVDAQLGRWLIEHGQASRTRLIIPDFVRKRLAA